MPPLQPEREWRERTNSATIVNRCTEFDRRKTTESRAIKGLWAYGRRIAFTMAEILLSLTIIGVVAAITLPSLTGNINERTWDTQRKALHARLAQAIALMPALNGYGSYIEATSSASAVDTVAETFVTSGLAKVLKINNICDFEHLTDCGITKTINPLTGHGAIDTPTKWSELNSYTINPLTYDNTQVIKPLKDTRAAGMETANGESISILYNPECQFYMNERSSIENYNLSSKICLNLIYDLNGQKGPNTVGKDIGFITVFYPTDSVIAAPLPTNTLSSSGTDQKSAIALCKKQNNESRLPTIDELGSLYLNQKLVYGSLYTTQTDYWSATKTGTNKGWYMGFTSGNYWTYSNSVTRNCKVQCIKR